MIKKIKNRINTYVDGKLKRLFEKHRKINQIQFNYAQLNQLFTDTSFFIPLSDWAISPSTITHVLNDIVVNNRKSIIEFGSGASTLYIAKLLKSNNIQATFYSVESDLDWGNKIIKQLEVLDLTSYVTIINAPIQSIDPTLALGEQKLWYDVSVIKEQLKSIHTIDLVLVDGPFGGLTPNSRYSALPFLKDKLASSYSVFLDDVGREDEQQILEAWNTSLNCKGRIIERYAIFNPKEQFLARPFQLR
ncbi:class I SAM-dependent methyltransferase [Formosa sp. PL04]|uniref:class I SAM-dependent methyltransferase n=1 Tax=Formosa sp. PL04 TaxID=3081755 RepID=UPI002982758A|nr:class I SAM-dependent methyltransferase [Formosa sp. PL04]MDW5290753.1 class I SAM-dependent methyltransferase [Formosa sp. PL04]